MAHSHSNAARPGRGAARPGGQLAHEGAGHQVTADELYRHRRALRILIVVLIPLGIWTLVGLVVVLALGAGGGFLFYALRHPQPVPPIYEPEVAARLNVGNSGFLEPCRPAARLRRQMDQNLAG